MSQKTILNKLDWPSWAPPRLVDEYIYTHNLFIKDNDFVRYYLTTIQTLCTSSPMERVWEEIEKHISDSTTARKDYYQIELAEIIAKTLGKKPTILNREKYEQAANAADKLRGLYALLELSNESVIPIIGTKAISGIVNHFISHNEFSTIPTESRDWAKEISLLSYQLETSYPGVGSIDTLLRTLAKRLRDPKYHKNHTDGSDESRAKNLCINVGIHNSEMLGTPLYRSIGAICRTFFPNVNFNARNVLNAAGIKPKSDGVVKREK